jgi:hypothetical protein
LGGGGGQWNLHPRVGVRIFTLQGCCIKFPMYC